MLPQFLVVHLLSLLISIFKKYASIPSIESPFLHYPLCLHSTTEGITQCVRRSKEGGKEIRQSGLSFSTWTMSIDPAFLPSANACRPARLLSSYHCCCCCCCCRSAAATILLRLPVAAVSSTSSEWQASTALFHLSFSLCVCVCVCVRTGWKNLLTYVYVCISLKERAGQTHPLLLPFLVHICVRRVFCPSSLSLCFLSLSVPARLVAS